MKLQSKKRTFLASFLILFLIPSHSAEFEINFIETFDENYMLEVLQELKLSLIHISEPTRPY